MKASEYVYCNGEGAHDDIPGPQVFLRSDHELLLNDRCEYVEPTTQLFTLDSVTGNNASRFVLNAVELMSKYDGPVKPHNPTAHAEALRDWPVWAETYRDTNNGHGVYCDQGERDAMGQLADGVPCDACAYFEDETVSAVMRALEQLGYVVDDTWGGDGGVAVYVTWQGGELRHVSKSGVVLTRPGTDAANHSPRVLDVDRDDGPCIECANGVAIDQQYGYTAPPESGSWVPVQACDTCKRWPTDENAAAFLARIWGTEAIYVEAAPDDEEDDHPGDWYALLPTRDDARVRELVTDLATDLAALSESDQDLTVGADWAREMVRLVLEAAPESSSTDDTGESSSTEAAPADLIEAPNPWDDGAVR